MRFLRENWFLKLICLASSIVLSVYVRRQFDEAKSTFLLPINLRVATGQRVVEPAPGSQIRVDLSGPQELIHDITADTFVMKLDTDQVRPDKRTIVPIELELPPKFAAVQLDWHPRSVGVRTVADATKRLPIQIRPTNRPADWEWRDMPSAAPQSVDISGSQQAVARVGAVIASFTVQPQERISEPVILKALDADGNDITNEVRLEPAQTLIKGVQDRVVLRKQVTVQPVIQPLGGSRILVEGVTPPKVSVQGPIDATGRVYLVETPLIRVAPGETLIDREVTLVSPDRTVKLIPDKVRVRVRVVPAGGKAPGKPPAKAP